MLGYTPSGDAVTALKVFGQAFFKKLAGVDSVHGFNLLYLNSNFIIKD